MFFPVKSETFASPLSSSEVEQRMVNDINHQDESRKNWFKGEISDGCFNISLILKRPNNFTPLISGLIEKDADGKSLIIVKYELFPSTKRFLLFWTILTLLLTLFFAIPYQAYLYGAITFSAGLVNYIITKENFKIQIRKSRRALLKVVGATE